MSYSSKVFDLSNWWLVVTEVGHCGRGTVWVSGVDEEFHFDRVRMASGVVRWAFSKLSLELNVRSRLETHD